MYLLTTTPSSHTHRFHPLPLAIPASCSPHLLATPIHSTTLHNTFNLCKVQSMDDNCGEWVDCITVDEDLHGDLQSIMNEYNDQVRGENSKGTFQHTFWDQQLQASKMHDSRQMRWHSSINSWCLQLKLSSGSAYSNLRESGVLRLPSEHTLRDYTHHIPSHGIAAGQLYPVITEAIMQLQLHGFKVISITSDGAAPNRKLYHMMHVGDANQQQHGN